MMRLMYEEMMIEKVVRNFILYMEKIEISVVSQKFLPYREISVISCRICLLWLISASQASMSNMRMMRNFISDIVI